jgi:hypothetical protein
VTGVVAPDFQRFRPFTILCAVKGPAICFARLLNRCENDMPRGSMLAWLAVDEHMPAMPRYRLERGERWVFESYVPEEFTAEEGYAKLIEELRAFGFEPAPLELGL